MTKLYAQEKRVFDINKVTVVGSPSISEDGVASGFSATSYIQKTLETPLTQDDNFKINLSFTTSNVGAMQEIVSFGGTYRTRPRLDISTNAVLKFTYLNSSGTEKYANLGSVTQNTRYNLEIISRNGNLQILVNGTEKLNTNDFSCNITGLYSVYVSNWFTGSIDLNAFKIYVDGELVYSPTKPICYLERRKEGFDLSKFTVVGSPTITDDGVASGFSGSGATPTDYISVPNVSFSSNSNFEIKCRVIAGNSSAILRFFSASNNTFIFYDHNAAKWQARLNNVSVDVFKMVNADDIVSVIFSKNNNNLSLTMNNLSSGTSATNTKTYTGDSITVSNIFLGGGYGAWAGSINLPSFSITVDGKEVFTGAKEKFYAMQGGM